MNIVKQIKLNGGATIDLSGNIVNHSSGYYVAILSIHKIPVGELSALGIKMDLMVLKYLYRNIRSRYLGLWIDQGICYVDVSIHVKSRWYAMLLGRWHKQMSIWDCKNGKAREVA